MSKLIIVPTPIGNMEDITLRALRILKEADCILAEDTRTSANLLKHFDIKNKLIAFHKFNEHKALQGIMNLIMQNNITALISDAGTPSISDPGFLLVRECVKNEIEIECLPGATALIPALVISGFPSDSFCFEGFLPVKKGRLTKFTEIQNEKRTVILYESPHRLLKTLEQINDFFPEREISVSRELSKIHEETIRGKAAELIKYFSPKTVKGEIVIVINNKKSEQK